MTSPIPWQSIDTVLLDMDGTILDLAFDNYFWLDYIPMVYAQKKGISEQESRQFLAETYDAIAGTLQWYCLDHWTKTLGVDVVKHKYQLRERVAFRPGALAFLQFLKSQGKRTILVTNAHRKSLEIKLLVTEFSQYFEALVSSHDFGYPKEEQAFWQSLQQAFEFNKERTLFIDDSVRILRSAEEYGVRYLYGIAQPDMRFGTVDSSPYPSIEHFNQVTALHG